LVHANNLFEQIGIISTFEISQCSFVPSVVRSEIPRMSTGARMIAGNFYVGPDGNASALQSPQIRTLQAGEILFREGELKANIYRVESGAICTYALAGAGKHAYLEFIYAADWLGFGYLDRYTSRARAVVETRVLCFPLSWANALVELNPKAKARLLDAIEREFEIAHASLVRRERPNPIERVAELLLRLASVNGNDDRDPRFIVDSIPYDAIASSLMMSVETLADVLIVFELRGLIEPHAPAGLRLKDIAALEAIADGLVPDERLATPTHPRRERRA
jgi:CRP/FNR family transcriptional regulator